MLIWGRRCSAPLNTRNWQSEDHLNFIHKSKIQTLPSLRITENVQDASLPAQSVNVYLTGVVPIVKKSLNVCVEFVTIFSPVRVDASVTFGSLHLTKRPVTPTGTFWRIVGGHSTSGLMLSAGNNQFYFHKYNLMDIMHSCMEKTQLSQKIKTKILIWKDIL